MIALLKKFLIAALPAAVFLSDYMLGRRACRSNSSEIGVITKTKPSASGTPSL